MTWKPIQLEDKPIFNALFFEDPPTISELTFTNLFMWRHRNHPVWKLEHDCLLIVMQPQQEQSYGLQPVGKGNKEKALKAVFAYLESFSANPFIGRVSEDFVDRYVDLSCYQVVEDPANSDYVYLAKELIDLPGNRFHKKRNHVNKFMKSYEFQYRPLTTNLVDCFLRLQEDWCELRNCAEDPDLAHEDRAVYEALIHMEELDFKGGAILIDSRVEAFSLGEYLNRDTVVIHIEKANPHIPGLYAAINNLFCKETWADATYINREQDLGIEGLRRAKESYHPHHKVKKFIVTRR